LPTTPKKFNMGYLHIENLYRPKAQVLLLFRECYALEKIHGTSAHITFKYDNTELGIDEIPVGWRPKFFSGGESYDKFVSLFNAAELCVAVKNLGIPIDKEITVFGEAYGGKCQGMSGTYGKELKFIVFDVQVGDCWLNVPDAEDVAKKLGLEFVYYKKCSLVAPNTDDGNRSDADAIDYAPSNRTTVTYLKEIDDERDAPSVQAIRNGISKFFPQPEGSHFVYGSEPKNHKYSKVLKGLVENPKTREGVVLRPLVEMTLNDGSRIIVKHKGDAFKETATPRPVVDPTKLKVLDEANAIANEWVTQTRLEHVLQKLPAPHDMKMIPQLIQAMTEDVLREAEGEIVVSDAAKKAIGKKAVELFKATLNSQISK